MFADANEGFCVRCDATLRDALVVIDSNAIGLAVVRDIEQRVIGVVSDGDIRRALLSGRGLEDRITPHISRDYVFVSDAVVRSEVLDVMQARHVHQVPIIGDDDRLLGMHTLRAILGGSARPNWAVIMAGGKGMRLRPITERLPKPMIQVAGRPILERLVLHLVGNGIRRVFLAVNYLPHVIEEHFGDGDSFGCKIEYLREEEPLGSGGAISLLPERPEHPLVLLNGDLIMQSSIAEMLDHHSRDGDYATMGVRPYLHEIPFGCVEVVPHGPIKNLEEKPVLQKTVNAGVYVLSPAAVSSVPDRTFFPVTQLFQNAIEDGKRCGVFFLDDDWLDVGQPGQLREAQFGRPD